MQISCSDVVLKVPGDPLEPEGDHVDDRMLHEKSKPIQEETNDGPA